MTDSPSTWEYARLAVGHRFELTLKKWDEVADAAAIQHLPYVYRWETHEEHAWADSPIELGSKLAAPAPSTLRSITRSSMAGAIPVGGGPCGSHAGFGQTKGPPSGRGGR